MLVYGWLASGPVLTALNQGNLRIRRGLLKLEQTGQSLAMLVDAAPPRSACRPSLL
jgi:hypothetical protein